MNYQNDDLRIKEIKELLPPVALLEKFPSTVNAAETVAKTRNAIHNILRAQDDRLLVVIGPCSIHDTQAAKEYAPVCWHCVKNCRASWKLSCVFILKSRVQRWVGKA